MRRANSSENGFGDIILLDAVNAESSVNLNTDDIIAQGFVNEAGLNTEGVCDDTILVRDNPLLSVAKS